MTLFAVGEWPLGRISIGVDEEGGTISDPVLLMGIDISSKSAIVVREDGSVSLWPLSDFRVDFRLVEGVWKDLEALGMTEAGEDDET